MTQTCFRLMLLRFFVLWKQVSIFLEFPVCCFSSLGPLLGRSGSGGEDGVPVPHVHWRGGPRHGWHHLHLSALAGGAGRSHCRRHPHRWLTSIFLVFRQAHNCWIIHISVELEFQYRQITHILPVVWIMQLHLWEQYVILKEYLFQPVALSYHFRGEE